MVTPEPQKQDLRPCILCGSDAKIEESGASHFVKCKNKDYTECSFSTPMCNIEHGRNPIKIWSEWYGWKLLDEAKAEIESQREIVRKLISQDHSYCLKQACEFRKEIERLKWELAKEALKGKSK